MKVTVKFQPIKRETLAIVRDAHEAEDQDPVAAYGRLLSAAMVAGAILELKPEMVIQQVEACYEQAILAVKNRKDIFGDFE